LFVYIVFVFLCKIELYYCGSKMLGSVMLCSKNWLIFRQPWIEESSHTPLHHILYMSLALLLSGPMIRSQDLVNHINPCRR